MDQAKILQQIQNQVSRDPHRFSRYEHDPDGFCKEILGVMLWDKQLEILQAADTHDRVCVRSGHSIGKSYAVACLTIWWLYAKKGLVITTAPVWTSVEGIIWREIANLHAGARVPLPGKMLETELKIDNTWYAIGLSTNTTEAFQGKHHPRLLVIVDEAPGVPEEIHLAVSTLATDPENCIVMIGNPTSMAGTFYEAFRKPELWYPIKISCFDHPNVVQGKRVIPGAVSVEQIEKWRSDWGENHPFWAPRVLGEFPRITTKGVIPLEWVERAQSYEKWQTALKEAAAADMPRIGGLDVARYGENVCVLTIRRGDAVESVESWHHLALTETAGRAIRAIKDKKLQSLIVDSVGIGAGVVDMLMEAKQPVYAYNGGHSAFTRSSFTNRRTEMWWHLRERFEKGKLWLPKGLERLVGDLVTPEYTTTVSGRIKVQSKEDLLDMGIKSPDFADSLVLCFAMDLDPLAKPGPTPVEGQDPWVYEAMVPVGQDQLWDRQLPVGY